jgi:PPOX class probable F420-dependent enzyme
MTETEALGRLVSAPVGRLATVGPDGAPHLVPFVFAAAGRRRFSAVDHKPKRARTLRRLANMSADPRVSVLVDHYEDDWTRLWWVRADGEARIVTSGAEFVLGLQLLASRFHQYRVASPDGPMIIIDIQRIVGWSAGS